MNLTKMLGLVVRQVLRVMHSDLCAVHLVEGRRFVLKAYRAAAHTSGSLQKTLSFDRISPSSFPKGKRAFTGNSLGSFGGTPFGRIARRNGCRAFTAASFVEKDEVIGFLSVYSASARRYSPSDEEELGLFANQIALAVEHAHLLESARLGYINTMKLLASVIDAKDRYTENHSEKVAEHAVGTAYQMGINGKLCEDIKYAGFLHDIGKINIEANILQKAGPLTKEEWSMMREHPKTASRIISRAGFLHELIPIILYHHLRFSGGGYPLTRKRGEEIPLGARILAVADAYEAMTSDRPYRRSMTKEQAIGELRRCAGTQFDPMVVKAFMRYVNDGKTKKYRFWKA